MGSWTIYVWTDIYTNFDMERCWRRECFGRIISGTYENLQLYRNHCSDYTVEDNLYRKLAGYKLNEKYVSNETIRRKV